MIDSAKSIRKPVCICMFDDNCPNLPATLREDGLKDMAPSSCTQSSTAIRRNSSTWAKITINNIDGAF